MVSSQKNTCKHFPFCGGCSFSQEIYSEQLQTKQKYINDLFNDLIIEESSEIYSIIPSPKITEARNKMEFSFYETLNQKGLGLIAKGKFRKIIPLEECLLIDKEMFAYLHATQNWWNSTNIEAFFPPKNIGFLCSLTIRKSQKTQEIMIILTTMSPNEKYNESTVLSLCNYLVNNGLIPNSFIWNIKYAQKGLSTYFNQKCLLGNISITEKLNLSSQHTANFTIYPDSFFQPNTLQAENILKTVLKFAKPNKTDILLDLYCGVGTIGIMLSPFFQYVLGIEIVPSAVKSAKENIQRNHIDNMQVVLDDVKNINKYLTHSPDTIVIDPPRCGLHLKVKESLLNLLPKKIIYISCNPKTQYLDITFLLKNYFIKKIQPIDQFPHSNHLENVVLLEQRTS